METMEKTKFCKHCGAKIPEDAVLCTSCGRQVETIQKAEAPQVVINNSNSNVNANGLAGFKQCNKWVSFCLCLFLARWGPTSSTRGKRAWESCTSLPWGYSALALSSILSTSC